MALIYWGQVEAASDPTMAAVTRRASSAFRAALTELIQDIAAGIIAGDPTIIAAAEQAVADALERWGITNENGSEFVVKDSGDRVALRVSSTGRTEIEEGMSRTHFFGTASIRDGEVSNQLVIKDTNERVALKIDRFGNVEIPSLVGYDGDNGGGGIAVDRVILACMLGQSNGEGRGTPISARLDPPNQRIRMWDYESNRLSIATVPTSSSKSQVGMSPITPIARAFAAETPSTAVVIVNTAVGGSGLVNDVAAGCWLPGYTGSNGGLLAAAISTITAARDAARSAYGIEPEVWFYWHQGESDFSTSETAYAAALDELIDVVRSAVGDSAAPFTIGGLVPEHVGAALEPIRAALMDTPRRKTYTAYTDGIPGGGGYIPGDETHYTRQGVLALGERMYRAGLRAAVSSSEVFPHKPLNVRGALSAGKLIVSWDEPDVRYTSFDAEFRVDGGSWVSQQTQDVQATFTGVPSGLVEVRARSRNGPTTSTYPAPVMAH